MPLKQYSVSAFAFQTVTLDSPALTLGPGMNGFSLFVEDIEPVVQALTHLGVKVLSVYHLSSLDTVPQNAMFLGDSSGTGLLTSSEE